jgi:tight adherence protein C
MDTSTALNMFAAASAVTGGALAVTAYSRAKRVAAVDTTDADAVQGTSVWRRIVSPLAVHIRPTNAGELEQLTTMLLTAGRRNRDAVERYCEERVAAMLASMVFALLWASWVGGLFGLLLSLVSIVLGILGPNKLLAMRAAERRDAIARALPAAVDLMTTCIEAGLSLEQSIQRVATELELSSPILANEFRTTASEFDAGVSLPDALRRLARRVGLDDLSALCGVIAQAHGLGAPIGNTLREYAQSSRRTRMSLLEERAGKLAAQLTLPLATCLLPAAMMVILGPAVIQLVRALQ